MSSFNLKLSQKILPKISRTEISDIIVSRWCGEILSVESLRVLADSVSIELYDKLCERGS